MDLLQKLTKDERNICIEVFRIGYYKTRVLVSFLGGLSRSDFSETERSD